jgi:hypothetical protein
MNCEERLPANGSPKVLPGKHSCSDDGDRTEPKSNQPDWRRDPHDYFVVDREARYSSASFT